MSTFTKIRNWSPGPNTSFAERIIQKYCRTKKLQLSTFGLMTVFLGLKNRRFLGVFWRFLRFFDHFFGSIFEKMHFGAAYELKNGLSG